MASCGWRASTSGARACRTDGSATSPTDGAGTCRADGTGISRANGTDISGADGSDILAGCGGSAERTAPVSPEQTAPISLEQTAAIFWPDAAADLVDYVFFPKGNDRFWAHGYDSIVYAAFAASDLDDQRTKRSPPAANQLSDAASPAKAPLSSADLCGTISAAADADALIERIERAIGPSASQRDVLEQLRAALVQAIDRIDATCPALVPATFTERLNAIQDRIWIMHDALLTLRLPFENFYNSLTDEQQRRLRRDEPKSGESGASVTDGRAQTCAEPAA